MGVFVFVLSHVMLISQAAGQCCLVTSPQDMLTHRMKYMLHPLSHSPSTVIHHKLFVNTTYVVK